MSVGRETRTAGAACRRQPASGRTGAAQMAPAAPASRRRSRREIADAGTTVDYRMTPMPFIRGVTLAAAVALTCAFVAASAQNQQPAAPAVSPWAEWIEPDFPFFSSVLDAGRAGPEFPARNLTPRGLVLNLGRGHWVGFDTDLLRVAAVWRGTRRDAASAGAGVVSRARSQDAGRTVAAARARRQSLGSQWHLPGMAGRSAAVARRSTRAGANDHGSRPRPDFRCARPLHGGTPDARRRRARVHRTRRSSARVDDRRREQRTIGDRAQPRRRSRGRAAVVDAGIHGHGRIDVALPRDASGLGPRVHSNERHDRAHPRGQ